MALDHLGVGGTCVLPPTTRRRAVFPDVVPGAPGERDRGRERFGTADPGYTFFEQTEKERPGWTA
ncbi:hypothetical protein GCM10018784_74970 [Streptomyces hydrogenans]|nr:hypothetical protein GCM10018784_74970 [Streptomyces hydrogenans]